LRVVLIASAAQSSATADVPQVAQAEGTAPRRDRARLLDHVETNVFGVTGLGHKFIYVFDRSGSMAELGGRPLAAAKRELIKSLQDLNETTQFQVIFYNQEPRVFRFRSQSPRLVWANDEGKDAATQFVRSIQASGGTEHLQALKMALRLNPDVVFFLTDADEPRMSDDDLNQVRRWNQTTAIHAIEFGSGPQAERENFLVRLAEQNGGRHVYVDVTRLGDR
jgi:hypothetical protein